MTAVERRPGGRTRGAPRGDHTDAVDELFRAYKGTLAAQRRLRGRDSRHPGELSHAQYHLLFCLRDAEALPTGEIALAADVSPATVTEMLEALAQAGLVQRTRSERDRRVVLTSLTERGRGLVEDTRARFESRYRTAMAQFSAAELRAAAAVLDGLREMFNAFDEERRPS